MAKKSPPTPEGSRPPGKATIRDVAKRANVSIATVSRVVNKNYHVDPETTEKVEKAILDTGYYPNAIARTMRLNESFVVGLVVSDLSNNHSTLIAKMLEKTIEPRGYSLIVCSSDGSNQTEERYLRTLMSKKVDGIVVQTNGGNDRLLAELSTQLPVLCVYRRVRDQGFRGDFVGTDDFDAAYRLTSHVIGLGHRRIGIIGGDLMMSTAANRFAGFTQALREAGIRPNPALVHQVNFHFESGVAGAQKLMAVRPSPTILVALSNAIALGVMTQLREMRLAIPGEISFASIGDLPNRALLFVQPTLVEQDPSRIGIIAGDLLLERIADKSRPPETILVPSPLLSGESVARLN